MSAPVVLNDGFAPTRLNPEAFPTAQELNTGVGPLIEEREARFASKLAPPRTDAFMSDLQARFAALRAQDFLHSPQSSEGRFVAECGERVPGNYLALFEQALYLIHLTCATAFTPVTGNARPVSQSIGFYTDVLYFDVEAYGAGHVDLAYVNVRPCAESFGFLRLLLHELARNCLHYGANLEVHRPVKATQAILRRAWGDSHLFEYPPDRLQDPAQTLAVAHLLLLPPPSQPQPPPAFEVHAQHDTARLVAAFVDAEPRERRFASGAALVDAFYEYARVHAPATRTLRVRPDVILSLFQRQRAAQYQRATDEWVLLALEQRPVFDEAHGGAQQSPDTEAMVLAFVDAQRRGARFNSGPELVDAFYDYARGRDDADRALLRARPDVILSLFLQHQDAAKYERATGEWVLRPVRKRDRKQLSLDTLVHEFLASLTERSMGVTPDELVERFQAFLRQAHGVQEPEAFFTPRQILMAFNHIDANPIVEKSDRLKRYVVHGEPLYALGCEGDRVINPAWHFWPVDIARKFFQEHAAGPLQRLTLRELIAELRARMDALDIPREFYSDRMLQQSIESLDLLSGCYYTKVRIGRAQGYEFGAGRPP